MSPLRANAEYQFGPSIAKFLPKNTDGSTALPYPGKTEVVAFSGLGPFDFSGTDVTIGAVPFAVKNNTVEETKNLDLSGASDPAAVTVTEFIAAVTTAAFTGVTASVDARGYGEILISGGDAEADYIQVYGQGGLLAKFGNGYGLKIITIDTQQTLNFTPVNIDDETIEVIDSNGKKTAVITPGYREAVTAAMVDTAVDDELRALLTGGSYDPNNKVYFAPLPDAERTLLSMEVANRMYLKDTNQDGDWIGTKVTRAFNMSAKEDSTGDGARAFQTPNYSFNGTPYTDPETKVKYGDSYTKNYTKAQFLALDYENI